ncbi:MAG: thiopurine S-methyltransferase [Sedimenticola sp.]|nr:thiopurine S-methyltransferase [Sedimenticola sp.]
MDKAFWHERWQNNQIGFHQQEINSHLQRFWEELALPAGSSVFVPLCGKSRDMLWLREQGHPVLGVEISPRAVADFFAENGLEPEISEPRGGLQRWAFDDLVILCGDLFELQPDDVSACRAIYDRASLIALPPAMRPDYAQKMNQLFSESRPTLLVTMEYPQEEMKGPPFSVDETEVRGYYGGRFRVRDILKLDILAENPRFRERGLSHMYERVYLLQP